MLVPLFVAVVNDPELLVEPNTLHANLSSLGAQNTR